MIILGIGLIAVCLGGAVGYIAVLRGRSFVPWFLYGTLLGPIALPHALLSSNRSEMEKPAWSPIRYGLPSGHRNCPYCDAVVHEDAIACRRCRRPFYGPGSEGAGEGEGQGEDEPAEEPFAFEALEAAIARRSAAAHGRRGGRREPPPQETAERREPAPSPEEAPAARQADTDGGPSREAAGGAGRAEKVRAALRPDAQRSAAARTATQPGRSAPAPQPEAADENDDRSDDGPAEVERPAAVRDGETARPAARGSEQELSGTRRPGSPWLGETTEKAAERPDTPANERNGDSERGGVAEGRDQRPQPVPEPPRAAPANDPAAPRPETTTTQPEPGHRPAAARAHQRWRDAAAARHGEQRTLRAGDRPGPGPGPGPQDDLWATWRGAMPKSGADRTKRAAQAAAAVLCVIAVGGIAWWYGPTVMQQMAMAPSLFGGDGASTDLDGRAVEVPERELASPAPNAGGGSPLGPEGAARSGDNLTALRPPAGDGPSGDGGSASEGDGAAGKPTDVPSQPPVKTAEVPAPTGSAAKPGDEPGDAASDGGTSDQSTPPAETATTSGASDAKSSQTASRDNDASASSGGKPTRLERQPEPADTPTSDSDSPAQRQPIDDLVQAVTAALAEHTGKRNASTDATSASEGRATPAAVRITATGDLVARVQQLLRARGFAPGPIDGRAGPQTREAIRKYQERMGMRTTGEIDKAMLISLGIL